MLPETKFAQLISKSFLCDVLQDDVVEFRVSTGSKQGDNVASSLIAIDVKTASNEFRHIVIKTPPYDNPSQYTYVKRFRIFELENQFYKSLVPQLQLLHSTAAAISEGHQKESFDLPLPKYYGGTEEFLALEDVRPLGFKMADKHVGLRLDEVKLVMEKLGKYHATTYSFLREKGNKFFQEDDNYLFLNRITNNVHCPEHNVLESKAFKEVYGKACEILETKNPSLGSKIKKLYPKSQEIMTAIYNATDVKYFPIISHGDIWINNLIFQYETESRAEVAKNVIFLDFQQARRENIFWDLLYFVYTSTTPSFRENNLIPSLMVYYENFVKTLENLKVPLPIGFSKGWLIDEFYENLPSIFAYLAFAIPLQLGDFTTLGLASPKQVNYDNAEKSLISNEQAVAQLEEDVPYLLKASPLALDRFEAIAKEFDRMKVFDKF